MENPADPGTPRRSRARRWLASVVTVALLAALVVLALEKIDLTGVGHALARAGGGWIALACGLLVAAFLARGESWFAVIRAALPGDRIGRPAVLRALLIGMAGSTVAPGRLGEAARVLVIARHVGDRAGRLATLAGTVLAQTLLNLFALAMLAAVALGDGAIRGARTAGILTALGLPMLVLLAFAASQAIRRRAGGRPRPLPRPLQWVVSQVVQAHNGLRVFREWRGAVHATGAQLAAWVLQCACCYAVLLAFDLRHRAVIAAVAVLLAVNLTAVLPLTPSNVGVFQAACVAVLAAFGVPAGPALAYGLMLQAIEIVIALGLGLPSLVGEGISIGQLRELTAPGDGPRRDDAA